MDTRNIKLTLAYDGTDFFGWQVQRERRTVQGVLQDALERMHGHPVRVVGAGRTDSGVHATGQVASFFSDMESIPPEKFRDAINSYLPRDLRVLDSEEAGPRFHARRSALQRVYRYYIVCAPVLLPQQRNYRLWLRRRPDIVRLNEMASVLLGEHDFSCFTAEGAAGESRTRQVSISAFHAEGATLVYTIAAGSFLWKMVRTIVGTFLMLEEEGLGVPELAHIIAFASRANAGATAPARGLFLERVVYGNETSYHPEAVERAEHAGGSPGDGILPQPS